MTQYDFYQLNDKEFEVLVNDLLSKELGITIERFKAGRDQGIDGLFCYGSKKEIVVQSKHYLATGYSGLISTLKSTELPKVLKLNPSKYIVATSLPLSLKNKEDIMEIFSPYIKSSADVYGQNDLNFLLSKYKDIEKNHYKLWLLSTNILQSILHNGITGRSRDHLKRILNNSRFYVETEKYAEAIKKIEKEKVIVVSGIPGIGKTTLAENLCLYYSAQNYQFNFIQNVREGEDVFTPETNQIFYFDDFLGSNYLDIVEGNSDSHIIKFIERIKSHKNKLLVLTSRTNILHQGLRLSDHFRNSDLEHQEFILTIKALSAYDKALILYNHMWFSNLDTSLLNQLYLKKNYNKIINHKNFNPRLIELITNMNSLKGIDVDSYVDFIFATLDNPEVVWEHCFKRQSDSMDRALILLTVFNGGDISENLLKESFNNLKINKFPISNFEKELSDSLRDIVKIFLNRNSDENTISYTVYNPSVSDYIVSKYVKDTGEIIKILETLGTIDSLKLLNKLIEQKVISSEESKKIINALIKSSFLNNKSDINYLIELLNLDVNFLDPYKEKIKKMIINLFKNPIEIKDLNKLLYLINKFIGELKIDDLNVFEKFYDNRDLNESELSELLLFLNQNNIIDEKLQTSLSDQVMSCVYDIVMDVDNLELSIEDFFDVDSFGGIVYFEDEMIKVLSEITADIFVDLNATDYMHFIDDIISDIDVVNIIDRHIEGLNHEDYLFEDYKEQAHFSKENIESEEEMIQTLFSRT